MNSTLDPSSEVKLSPSPDKNRSAELEAEVTTLRQLVSDFEDEYVWPENMIKLREKYNFLVATLNTYLELKSSDGKPQRQQLREQLKTLCQTNQK